MFTRTFRPDRFLRSVTGTEVFAEYCRLRHVAFSPPASPGDALRLWTAALAQLPHELHALVELELATVNEMAGRDTVAHLVEAAPAGGLPPDVVPAGAPLALWFFLNHPALFHEVFLQHEIEEVDSWRTGRAEPGVSFPDPEAAERALGRSLREFFGVREGTGRFCVVECYGVSGATCFVAQVADRLQFLDAFTDGGEPTRQRMRPAVTLLFVYYPSDGTVLLKSHLRAHDRAAELFRRFGEAVVRSPVRAVADAFHLEALKLPFHPLPDGPDMEQVRLKALHLRYPERAGRRQLKLETHAGDDPSAIEQLLRSHVGPEELRQLRVSHAELQVRLRVRGRLKNYRIRLWPDRSNLSRTEVGGRFRHCLERWGLSHAR